MITSYPAATSGVRRSKKYNALQPLVRIDSRVAEALEQPYRVGPVAADVVRRLAARVRLRVDLQEQFVDQVRDLLAH